MIERVSVVIDASLSAKYILPPDRDYRRQYAGTYKARYDLLKEPISEAATKKWPDAKRVTRLVDTKLSLKCFIIGTIYRNLSLRSSIFDELGLEYSSIEPSPMRENLCSEDDPITLEDDHGRVLLEFLDPLLRNTIVSGSVLAVLGEETSSGGFLVEDVCYPGLPLSIITKMEIDEDEKSNWIAIVSGLNFGNKKCDLPAAGMMFDYLSGELCGNNEELEDASKISQLILLGNNFESVLGAQQLDNFLFEASRSIGIILVPGINDLATRILPQQPVNPNLFPKSRKCITSLPNPMILRVKEKCIISCSGQNIDDVSRYMPHNKNRLEIADYFLKWRHMAPSAPDTLFSYPFSSEDPFLIDERPQILLLGNQPSFETSLYNDEDGENVRIILIPKFYESKCLVLLNTETNEVKRILFNC